MFIKRFFAFVISALIIFTPLTSFAASSWTVSSSVSSGSRSIVTATKAGFKSAVNIAPTAGRLALRLKSGLNWASLLYAAVQLAPDLADIKSFQPEYANNRVRYDVKTPYQRYVIAAPNANVANISNYTIKLPFGATLTDACKALAKSMGYPDSARADSHSGFCKVYGGSVGIGAAADLTIEPSTKIDYISIPAAAAQVIKNADAGHADSRAATRETATEMVIGGQFDQDLLNGAVPTNDTRPLVPSVPISGNGNVGGGIGVGTGDDGLMTGGDLGKAADDARVAADNARKAAQAAKDAATAAANDARVAADKANDLINSAVDQAIKDAAKATADAAAQAAKDAAAVSDAAVKAANDRAAAAERAAEAAASAAKEAAAQAAKDLDAAKAAGDAAAIAAAQAAKDAADAALADAKAKQEAAEKAAEKAKAEAAKPFELPAFCSWATPVCDFIEWFKADPPAEIAPQNVPFGTVDDVGLGSVDRYEQRIDFQGQCPSSDFSFQMMGVTFAKPIPYHYLCDFLTQIAPWLLAMCYLGTAYFVVENV